MSVAVSAHSAMGSGSFASDVSAPPTASSPNVGASDTFLLWMVECDIASVPTAGDLVLATMGIGQGPGLAVTSPTGAVWDLCTFTGENDTNLIENADACAHLYNSPATTQNFDWSITNQASNTVVSLAVAIKAALASVVPAPGPPATRYLGWWA